MTTVCKHWEVDMTGFWDDINHMELHGKPAS